MEGQLPTRKPVATMKINYKEHDRPIESIELGSYTLKYDSAGDLCLWAGSRCRAILLTDAPAKQVTELGEVLVKWGRQLEWEGK